MVEKKRRFSASKQSGTADPATPVVISPDKFDAVIFDMDGVVTKTAIIHTSAWKETFDKLLEMRSGKGFRPFTQDDYLKYVDGKPREDGVRDFLQSRGISLPAGTKDDEPGFDTAQAVGTYKNRRFLELLRTRGVESYETTVALIRALQASHFKIAVVTASRNGEEILEASHTSELFEAKVDGNVAEKLGLPGKPNPDTFLEAALRLGVSPGKAVVVEDAAAGVEAGHRGDFGLVIGVARSNDVELLKEHGADVVVQDLSEVSVSGDRTNIGPGTAWSDMDITDENWVLSYDEFSPELEKQRESMCAVGNGYFCTRAAAPESEDDGIHYPGTYLAGGYDRITLAASGKEFEQEQLVNLPNWLSLTFKLDDDEWFNLANVEILKYQQRLDMRAGFVNREIKFRDKQGHESTLLQKWFVHMDEFHLAALETKITSHNWSGKVTIRSAIDGRVINNGTTSMSRPSQHLHTVHASAEDSTILLETVTNQSKLVVAQAARHRIIGEKKNSKWNSRNFVEASYVAQELETDISPRGTITFHKTVSLYTSRDSAISEAGLAAREAVAEAPSFNSLLNSQILAWRNLWRQFDLFIETTEAHSKIMPSLLLHFNSFHALQTASPNILDLDVGLPARGWTGEGYEGHIFWDDLFMFPFINLRTPTVTEALLKYRYRRLDAARKIAKSFGAKGARFPWQSGSDGREETKFLWFPERNLWKFDSTHLQVHVNVSIAYNIWQYYQVTTNLDFIHAYGAEMMFEIARFFATFAKYNKERDRYELHGVVGPDEWHIGYAETDGGGIKNNAYTNIMVAWCLARALELLQVMPHDHREEIREHLRISDEEVATWDKISRTMYVPMIDKFVIEQFEGYEKLAEFPWKQDGQLDTDRVQQVLESQLGNLNQYKVSKQADVLMLFYVFSNDELYELFDRLGYTFSPEMMHRNIEYYLPRTANLSTLSRVAHAWVLSKLDRLGCWSLWKTDKDQELWPTEHNHGVPQSWDIFNEALSSDFTEVGHGSTGEGIHLAAMAGAIDIVQRCYTGIVTRGDVLWLNPQLPSALTKLSFYLHYRDQALAIEISHTTMRIAARHSSANPITIGFDGQTYKLNAGEMKEFDLTKCTYIHESKAA
jgi:beta-phosphoglucomutase family hydrolase